MTSNLLDTESADNLPIMRAADGADLQLHLDFYRRLMWRGPEQLEPVCNFMLRDHDALVAALYWLADDTEVVAQRPDIPVRWACFEVRVKADVAAFLKNLRSGTYALIKHTLPPLFIDTDVVVRLTGQTWERGHVLEAQLWYLLDRPAALKELATLTGHKTQKARSLIHTSFPRLPPELSTDRLPVAIPITATRRRVPLPSPGQRTDWLARAKKRLTER